MEAIANMKCFSVVPDAKSAFETFIGQQSGFHDDTLFQLFPLLVKAFSTDIFFEHAVFIATSANKTKEANGLYRKMFEHIPYVNVNADVLGFCHKQPSYYLFPGHLDKDIIDNLDCNVEDAGAVKGDTLIGMSIAPYIHYILPACEHFKDIIFAGPNDQCIQDVEKWRKNEPGAIDCSHVAKLVCKLQGRGENWTELHSMMQRKFKQVLHYDATKTNPLSPKILPQADCLLLTHYLECHAQNKEDFFIGLKNVSSLLKTGGHLIMIGFTDATFYMVGKYKYPELSINEDFVRKAVAYAGFFIEELQVNPRKVMSLFDVIDYSGFIFVKARKETNV